MIYYFYRLKFFSSILIQSCLLIYPYLFVYCTHKPMNMTYNFFVIHQYFLANRWRNNGKTMEMVRDFFLGGGSKITADGNCSHEIKRYLLPERKAMTNLDSIL